MTSSVRNDGLLAGRTEQSAEVAAIVEGYIFGLSDLSPGSANRDYADRAASVGTARAARGDRSVRTSDCGSLGTV